RSRGAHRAISQTLDRRCETNLQRCPASVPVSTSSASSSRVIAGRSLPIQECATAWRGRERLAHSDYSHAGVFSLMPEELESGRFAHRLHPLARRGDSFALLSRFQPRSSPHTSVRGGYSMLDRPASSTPTAPRERMAAEDRTIGSFRWAPGGHSARTVATGDREDATSTSCKQFLFRRATTAAGMKRRPAAERDRSRRQSASEVRAIFRALLQERLSHRFPIGLDPEPSLEGKRTLLEQHRQAIGGAIPLLSCRLHPWRSSASVNEVHDGRVLWNQCDI